MVRPAVSMCRAGRRSFPTQVSTWNYVQYILQTIRLNPARERVQAVRCPKRNAVPSSMIRRQTARRSSSPRHTQFDTSDAVRPHPLQTSSNSVVHTPMQGESGRLCKSVDISPGFEIDMGIHVCAHPANRQPPHTPGYVRALSDMVANQRPFGPGISTHSSGRTSQARDVGPRRLFVHDTGTTTYALSCQIRLVRVRLRTVGIPDSIRILRGVQGCCPRCSKSTRSRARRARPCSRSSRTARVTRRLPPCRTPSITRRRTGN